MYEMNEFYIATFHSYAACTTSLFVLQSGAGEWCDVRVESGETIFEVFASFLDVALQLLSLKQQEKFVISGQYHVMPCFVNSIYTKFHFRLSLKKRIEK